MAQITLKGNPINTIGELPKIGSQASGFTLVKSDLSEGSLSDYSGKRVVLNIFPSIDTGTCATSVRQFNQKASDWIIQWYYAFQQICHLRKLDFAELKALRML